MKKEDSQVQRIADGFQAEYPPSKTVYAASRKARYQFDLTGMPEDDCRRLFSKGWEAQYLIGPDRLIQNFLEVTQFQVEIVMYPLFLKSEKRHVQRYENILFWNSGTQYGTSQDNRELADGFRRFTAMKGATIGEVRISVTELFEYVQSKLPKTAPSEASQELLSIKKVSETIWENLSANMRGVLHNWMTKGPIFRPQHYVSKPSREGCRLSIADQVTAGLLYGMFSYGVKYDALKEPLSVHLQEHPVLDRSDLEERLRTSLNTPAEGSGYKSYT